jgi:hypothetical protein
MIRRRGAVAKRRAPPYNRGVAKVACGCGAHLDLPALEPGVERILLCQECETRTRVVRESGGKIRAVRLARPEVAVTCPCGERFRAAPPDAGGVVQCPRCGRAFDVRKETRPAPPQAFVGVAAAAGRNQDRAAWHAGAATGAVADGVTSSPGAAEAAELVCREAPVLFRGASPDAGLRALAGELLALRAALVAKPLGAGEIAAAGGEERAAAVARMAAYQTTLAAFRIAAVGGARELACVACGDSGIVAVHGGGALAALGLRTEPRAGTKHLAFPPRSGGTYCLPEGVAGAEARRLELPPGAWVVAGTDGFFGGFAGSEELLAWLERNRKDLALAAGRPALLAERHARLEELAGGDDDIAFVIAPPG